MREQSELVGIHAWIMSRSNWKSRSSLPYSEAGMLRLPRQTIPFVRCSTILACPADVAGSYLITNLLQTQGDWNPQFIGGREVGDTEHMVTETLIRGMYRYWREVMERPEEQAK